MHTSIELRQERARVVEAMRTITEQAEAANRNLDATEVESYTKGEADFRSLTERIERSETIERAEAENARSINSAGLPGGDQGNDGHDVAAQAKDRRSAFLQFIRRGTVAPEQRALIENPAGEILVPVDLETEILRSLPKLTVIRALASQRSVSTDKIRRRSLSEVAVGWGKLELGSSAGQTLTDTMPTTPTEEFTYIEDLYGLAKIGEDELDDTDANLESFVRDSFGRAIGEAEDTAFTVGIGHASKTPVGIFSVAGEVTANTSTAGTYAGTTVNAPAVLVDDLKRLIYALPAQYRRNGAFLMASSTELFVSTVKDGQGRYLWEPNTQAGRPNTFLGYAIHNQEDIDAIALAKSIAVFGDFNAGYRVYDRAGMTLQRLNELYAEAGMIGFKVRFRVGGDVLRPAAFKVLKTAAV